MYRFSGADGAAKDALWDSLVAMDGHWFEPWIRIYNGQTTGISNETYWPSQIIEMSTSYRLFSQEQPTVGGCLAGELTIRMLTPEQTIPRMALIIPYVRVHAGNQVSNSVPQGKFFIDTRETTKNDDGLNILTLHAYDAMLKTEADYPSTSHSWPYSDINVVNEIASAIGVGVDPRTTALMTKGYQISLPGTLTMREVLGNIAAMYAGNWIMNYDGQLLLVAINGIPPETNYLVDDVGDAITFGGDRILV